MAFTVQKRQMTFQYRDNSGRKRNRVVEIAGQNAITDDDANDMNKVSKSAVVGYWEQVQQLDMGNTPQSDSEVGDTTRLYFLMPDNTTGHYDIVDMVDDLFIATSGAGQNIVKEYADLDLIDPTENALKDIIDRITSGDVLISDGETPIAYLEGKRL